MEFSYNKFIEDFEENNELTGIPEYDIFGINYANLNINDVKKLHAEVLNKGIRPIDVEDEMGVTPLIVACELGATDIVKFLYNEGYGFNATYKVNDYFMPAKLYGIKYMDQEIVTLFKDWYYESDIMTFFDCEREDHMSCYWFTNYVLNIDKNIKNADTEQVEQFFKFLNTIEAFKNISLPHVINEYRALHIQYD